MVKSLITLTEHFLASVSERTLNIGQYLMQLNMMACFFGSLSSRCVVRAYFHYGCVLRCVAGDSYRHATQRAAVMEIGPNGCT